MERENEKMKQTEIIKGRGIKRKTSLGLVCGISLMGALFLGANGVSADEATTATPSTTAIASESKTVVVDEGLTETANKAKEAGLIVNAEPTKNIGTANTEEEAQKLDEQAKKEVADQKTEIEKKTADYKVALKDSEDKKKELINNLSMDPELYNKTGKQLRALADEDYDTGKASFGEFKSSNGTVRFLDSPNRVDLREIDPTVELLNSKVVNSPKEITSHYADASILGSASYVSDKKNVKVAPILVNDGETITYKVNYASDSKLGQMGVGYVEKSYTLKGSPVQSGKIALLANRYGTIVEHYVYGGLGKETDVIKDGQWSYTSSWTYYDKDGKKIDSKELASRFVNKYWYPDLGLKASDIKLTPTTENSTPPTSLNKEDKEDTSKDISYSFVSGGDSFFTSTRLHEEHAQKTENNPIVLKTFMTGDKVKPIVDTIVKTPTAPTVNYHLVSYTVNKAKATNNTDKLKKGSIVQVFIEEGGKEIAPKTNTGEKPVDETVTLNHPKEILFEGKTYTFTKQDKADPTKIPNGQETITYIYKLKETPKPVVVEEKKGDVEVRYIKDDASRTVLKEPVADTVGGKVGSDYDTTDNKPKTITKDGVTYEYVRSEGVEKGKVVEGKTVVTYVYREVQKPVTIHIDKEGNPVAPKEDGTKPFKDIEGYKPEPKDPKNVEDPKGVTVRVYEKVTPKPETPKTPETPQTPNTPEAPKPQPQQPTQAVAKATLPQTGEVASLALTLAGLGLLGLSGLAIKKRED